MPFCRVMLVVSLSWLGACESDTKTDYKQWDTYRGSKDAAQFSALTQITRENVHLLQPAWEFRTGDNGPRTPMECNPIVIGNIMYVTSPQLDLIALEADTGRQLWRFSSSEFSQGTGVNRGVT
jgi:quinoprotein glucose dehydrogenase